LTTPTMRGILLLDFLPLLSGNRTRTTCVPAAAGCAGGICCCCCCGVSVCLMWRGRAVTPAARMMVARSRPRSSRAAWPLSGSITRRLRGSRRFSRPPGRTSRGAGSEQWQDRHRGGWGRRVGGEEGVSELVGAGHQGASSSSHAQSTVKAD
jgi:hypothetical protein